MAPGASPAGVAAAIGKLFLARGVRAGLQPAAETAGRPVPAVLEDYLRKGGFQYARRPLPFNCRHIL